MDKCGECPELGSVKTVVDRQDVRIKRFDGLWFHGILITYSDGDKIVYIGDDPGWK